MSTRILAVKRKFWISFGVVIAGLSGIVGLYLFNDRAGSPSAETKVLSTQTTSTAASSPPSAARISHVLMARAEGSAPPISEQMSPEHAFADVSMISRCISAADGMEPPPDLTSEQKRHFEENKYRGLDCSALDSPYSVYQLAEYAARGGIVEAQLNFAALVAPMFNEEAAALDEELIGKFKSDSLNFLHMAADSGSADALSRLSDAYYSGRFGEKNVVQAYAYAYARDIVAPGKYTKVRADQLLKALRPEEVSGAVTEGSSIARQFK